MLLFEEQLAYPTAINEYLYLGSVDTLKDKKFMSDIKCVISVMKSPPEIETENVKRLIISIHDMIEVNITGYFTEVFEHINHCMEKKEKVLVHCEKGMSRSSSFVIAWLLQEDHKRGQEANYQLTLKNLVQKRSMVSPNTGFADQLCKYSDELNKALAKNCAISSSI